MSDLSATAISHPNIVFIKYWGIQDAKLRLPLTGSISMNLDKPHTTTSVAFDPELCCDRFMLNGNGTAREILARVSLFLDHIKRMAEKSWFARISSSNSVPAGGGIASSVSAFSALAMSSKFEVGNSSFRTETGQTKLANIVPFPAYTRAIIEKVGLYDEELVRDQDDEYNYRIRAAGGRILLADDVRSTCFSRGSFQKLWKQYLQYGYWKVRVLQKHPKQMSLRQFIPPLFVLSLLLTTFFSVTISWGWLTLTALTAIYLTANLIASFLTARTKGYRYFWSLPLAFTIIHVSYGLGFLFGLIKFSNRWHDKIGKVPQWQI